MAEIAASSHRNPARWLVVAIPYVWLVLFFAAPSSSSSKISLSDTAIAMPPYTPVFEGFGAIGEYLSGLDFENYRAHHGPALSDAYLSSLRISIISTFFCF